MKKFNFKLQSLQRVRAFKEEKIKIELGEIVSRMNSLREDNARLDKDIDEAFETQDKLVEDKVGCIHALIKMWYLFSSMTKILISSNVRSLLSISGCSFNELFEIYFE